MPFDNTAIVVSYAATIMSLVGAAVSLIASSFLPAETLAHLAGGERSARLRGRIAALLAGASIFPLVTGAPEAFLTLACCWLAAGIERAISQILENQFTRSFAIGMVVDFGLALLISFPYLRILDT